MARMTWKEFKGLVEAELKERGEDENVKMDYFDFAHPDQARKDTVLEIGINPDGLYVFSVKLAKEN